MSQAKERKREEAPHAAMARLAHALEEGPLAPAYVLRGEERWFRDRMSDLVLRAAAARGLETCRHDARHPEFQLARLCDDLRGGGLFASSRCVLLQSCNAVVGKQSADYSPVLVELIAARIAKPEGGTVVLAAESLGAEHALVKAAAAAGGWVVNCRKLWDTPPPWGGSDPARIELVAWLAERARAMGVPLRPQEALYVAQAVGNDLFALESELERLRARGARSVAEIVGWQAGAAPWTVAEALVSGDARAAALGIEALFRGGFQGRDGARTIDPAGLSAILLGQLASRIGEAIAASRVLARGGSETEAAAAAGASSPRAREALRARLASRPASEWPAMLEEVAALERRAHTGVALDASDYQLLTLRWRSRARSAPPRTR